MSGIATFGWTAVGLGLRWRLYAPIEISCYAVSAATMWWLERHDEPRSWLFSTDDTTAAIEAAHPIARNLIRDGRAATEHQMSALVNETLTRRLKTAHSRTYSPNTPHTCPS